MRPRDLEEPPARHRQLVGRIRICAGESASARANPHLPRRIRTWALASPPIELASWQASLPAAIAEIYRNEDIRL